MPLTLEGSCHCKSITFSFLTHTPVPYQLCQCTICRKVGGYMGSVNIMGLSKSLNVKTGKEALRSYKAVLSFHPDGTPADRTKSERFFCGTCSSMLWLHDVTYDEFIYPFASSIDTSLSSPNSLSSSKTNNPLPYTVVMRSSCPDHVAVPEGAQVHEQYDDGLLSSGSSSGVGGGSGSRNRRPPSHYTPSIASEDDEFFELEGYEVQDNELQDALGRGGGLQVGGELMVDDGQNGYGGQINGNSVGMMRGQADDGDTGSRDSTETARPDYRDQAPPSLYATPLLTQPDPDQTPFPLSYSTHFPSAFKSHTSAGPAASSALQSMNPSRYHDSAGTSSRQQNQYSSPSPPTPPQQDIKRRSRSFEAPGSRSPSRAEPSTYGVPQTTGLGIAIKVDRPQGEYDYDGVDEDGYANRDQEPHGRHSMGMASQARREMRSPSGMNGHVQRIGRLDDDGYGRSDPNKGMGTGTGGSAAAIRMRRMEYLRECAVTGTFILSWYTFATLLSLYNKWMFSPQYYGFSFPLFVTFMHMLVQFFLAWAVRVIWSEKFRPKERPGREEYAKKIVPTAFATGMDIGLSNLSLKTITLTLYTMCKSSSLIFVIGFAFLFHLEQYSLRLLCVITCISFGVFLMVFDATTVSIPGIIMVFSASALGGLRWAFTQLLMHKKEMGMSNPFATIFWLAPAMAGLLAVLSMIIEGWITIFSGDFFGGWKGVQTMLFIVFPGALAFAMVASEYYIIQRAGIVPLSIAGIFKEVSTITVSAWVFGDELTKLNVLGVVVTIGGIALYSYHKYRKSVLEPEEDPHRAHDIENYEAYESLGLQAQESAYPSQRLSFAGDGMDEDDMEMGEGGGGVGIGKGDHHVLGGEGEDEDEDDLDRARANRGEGLREEDTMLSGEGPHSPGYGHVDGIGFGPFMKPATPTAEQPNALALQDENDAPPMIVIHEASDMTITHIVAFQWKAHASEEGKQRVIDGIDDLQRTAKIDGKPYILNYRSGIQNSPEGKNKGIQFVVSMEFRNDSDRRYYLEEDPAHLAFVESVPGFDAVEDVLVLDFTV